MLCGFETRGILCNLLLYILQTIEWLNVTNYCSSVSCCCLGGLLKLQRGDQRVEVMMILME
jgi:hypothetical protein